MRRSTAALALPLTALVVAACGGGAATSSSKPAAAKHYSVTLIVGTTSDAFYQTMNCGAEAEANLLGMSYTYAGPSTFTPSQQIPIVNSVTAKHPDAVLIAPTSTTALVAPMKSMEQAGIKIIEVDTTINNGVTDGIALSSISSNNLLGGEDAANELATLMGGKGTAIVINVDPGISTTDARAQGFIQEMKSKYPNITVLPTQYDNDSASTAESILEDTYAAHPSLTGVFAANVLTAEGVSAGISHVGKSGVIKDISFDAEPPDKTALDNGTIQAVIAQEPALEGEWGVIEAYNALTGKHVTPTIRTGIVSITKANESADAKYFYSPNCVGISPIPVTSTPPTPSS